MQLGYTAMQKDNTYQTIQNDAIAISDVIQIISQYIPEDMRLEDSGQSH